MISLWSPIIIAVCLLLFFGVNLHNVLHYHRGSIAGTARPEVEEPHRITVGLAALGTGAFFLESLVCIVFGALGDFWRYSGKMRCSWCDSEKVTGSTCVKPND